MTKKLIIKHNMEMQSTESLQEKKKLFTRRRLGLDDVFTEYIGEGGKYQLFIVIVLAFNGFCSAGVFMDILWVADPKPHWCALPDDANPALYNLSLEERLNLTVPWIEKDDKWVHDSCNMYDLNYTNLDPQNKQHVNNKTAIVECTEWEFDTSEFNDTIVEKWEMVCDRRILIATSQSVVLAANPVGATVGGTLTDRFGRRTMALILSIAPIGFRMLQIFAPTLPVYMVSSFFVFACYMALYISTFSLGVEIVGPSYRYVMGLLGPSMWSVGAIICTGIAYFIRERVTLQLVLTIPLLFFLTYICLIPESPRWLIAKGRIKEANKILHKFAASNKSSYPEEEIDIALEEEKEFSILSAITSKTVLFRSFLMALGWWAVNFVYMGLTINVTNISGDLYLNMFILFLVELPGNFLCMKLIETRLGRRWTVGGSITLAGISLLLVAAVPKEETIAILVLVTISKTVISGGFTGIYVITAEMFPSEMRTATISLLNSTGKLVGMLTPFIAYLAVYSQHLPLLIFGTLPTVAGPLLLLLPETRGQPLPQTLEDVDNMKTNCCNKKGED